MGLPIEKDEFSEDEFERFAQLLEANLEALQELMQRDGFGVGPRSLGAELELDIVDDRARPLAVSRKVLAQHLDPQLQLELNRFNLEYNLLPVAPEGQPFGQLHRQLVEALAALRKTAADHGGRVVTVGILPTLRPQDLEISSLTDLPRYRALSNGLRRIRRAPFQIRIDGPEPLDMSSTDVTLEGANTSFQLHLRVDPDEFASMFNAAQLATPVALAVCGNSPIFLEHCLWQETRVALFKQAVDSRTPNVGAWRRSARVPFGHGWVRHGAYELFAEAVRLCPPLLPVCDDEDSLAVVRAGGVPRLSELRMQQGTVWQWNRPVYDPHAGGHLRVEFRALPSGPTPIDMVANAAFLIGLTVALQVDVDRLLPALPFRYAEFNFYRASQSGLDATLLWPTRQGVSPREFRAAELIRELLPLARSGLESLGVDAAEADRMLAIIEQRAATGQTASCWLRTKLQSLERELGRSEALAVVVNEYEALSRADRPVHEWPLEA